MGRKSSITPEQGEALLEAFKRLGNKSAAIREIGVSEDAGMRYLASAPAAAAPTIASQREIIATAGASLFDTRAALEENYQGLKQLIEQLQQGITILNGEYTTLTPPATLVAAFKEARGFTESAMKLYELMLRIDEIRKFQQEVLQAIGEVDEPTRQRIITNLRERRAVGLALHGGRD